MATQTANLKRAGNRSSASKNGKSTNGNAPKAAKRKKSRYERWIEKYGIDDSPTAQSSLEMWHMIYDAHNKPKS